MALALLRYLLSWFRAHHEVGLENIALRHQITVLQRQAHSPRLKGQDRVFWVVLRRVGPSRRTAVMIFQPETVIGWQRAGLRLLWRWNSRQRRGRPGKNPEVVALIRRMWAANPTWGSPRIRDELAKLGLQASTATIRKYRPRSRPRLSQGWRTFLRNHAGAIAAMDFFVVPTVTFRLLYVLVVMSHERRKVLHFNITAAPTAAWTAQPRPISSTHWACTHQAPSSASPQRAGFRQPYRMRTLPACPNHSSSRSLAPAPGF